MDDHDMLVETHLMVKELWYEFFGNGQQGMKADLAEMKTKLEERTGTSAVSKGAKLGIGSGIAGLLVAISIYLQEIIRMIQ